MRKKAYGFFILSLNWVVAALVLGALALAGVHAPSAGVSAAPAKPLPDEIVTQVASSDLPKPAERTVLTELAPQKDPAKAKPKPKSKPEVPEFVGEVGYALAYGNCVAEPGINNPGFGNPMDWPVTSQTPTIGATAVFTWNHVGVVTGIYRNGDIEVRHQNYWGGQHRFPPSIIRGYR